MITANNIGETESGMDSKNGKKPVWREILSYVLTIGITVVVMTCVLSANKVPSSSMEPTIKTHSLIFNWRLPYLLGDPVPEHGDIIVFESQEEKKLLVKRVIGLPGDTIGFEDGYVIRNGEKIDEPYVAEQGTTVSYVSEYEVPDGMLFVMGDNREHSRDSRFMNSPYIPVSAVVSKNLFHIGLPSF